MTSKTVSTGLSLVGLAVLGLGLLIGLAVPVHIAGAAGESCGTAFRPSYDWATTLGRSECAAALDTPRLVAFVIIGFGAIVMVTGLVLKGIAADIEQPADPSPY